MVAMAIRPDQEIPQDLLLGMVIMFEIRDRLNIPLLELRTLWKGLGLNERLLPNHRSPEDAFRKATPTKVNGSNLVVKPYKGPATISGSLIEAVVVETIDDDTEVALHHTDVAVLYLDTQSEFQCIPSGQAPPELWPFVHRVEHEFQRYLHHIDGTQMRGVIARVLREAHATRFRSGAYLVPQAQADKSAALINLIKSLNPYVKTGDPNSLVHFYYVDTPDQRKQLRDELAEHIQREAQLVISEARALIGSGKPIKSRDQSLRDRMIEIGFTLNSYESTLNERLTQIHSLLTLQKAALDKVLSGK